MKGNLYRYTTNGEGVFSAGRRLLDAQAPDFAAKVLDIVAKNKEWLVLPELEYDNLEFYWTENGKKKYEEGFLPIHGEYLPNIQLEITKYNELKGEIVYEDEHQVGIIASHDKSNLPNPYKK